MKLVITIIFMLASFQLMAQDKKPIAPNNQDYDGKEVHEKLMAWVTYCDLFLGNQDGYREDYQGLEKAAQQGLNLTPSNEYWFLSTFNYFLGSCKRNKDSARKYYQKAIFFGQKGNHTKKIITATSAILSEYGENIAASEPYRKILENILDTVKDDALKAEIFYGLSFYYENINWYETSLDYELKLLSLRKKNLERHRAEDGSSLKTNYGVTLNHIGTLYINLQQSNKALDYYRESLIYFEDYREAVEDSWKGMITAFSALGRADSVAYYYTKLYKSAKDTPKNNDVLAAANLAIADAALKYNQNDTALKYLDKAFAFLKLVEDEQLHLQWWMLKGNLEVASGNSGNIISTLKDWYQYAENGDRKEFCALNRLLAEASEQNGNFKEASNYYRIYSRLADSLTQKKISSNIAEKEAHYQNENKQQQLTLKNTQLAEVKKQKTVLLVAINLLIAVVILLITLYRNKKKTSAILDEKNENLSVLNEQLNQANRTKAHLFSIISHDLRSPISQVYQFLKLQQLKPQLLNEEQKIKLTEKIQTATGTLLEAMEDLLLWSKTQINGINPEKENFDLTGLLLKSANLVLLNIEAKNLVLIQLFPDELWINSDPNLVQTIIRNLLQNAVKAAPSHTKIIFEAKKDNDSILVNIKNEGLAFNQNDFNKIVSNAAEDASLSGLGLKLVSELSQKINIQISFSVKDEFTISTLLIPSLA